MTGFFMSRDGRAENLLPAFSALPPSLAVVCHDRMEANKWRCPGMNVQKSCSSARSPDSPYLLHPWRRAFSALSPSLAGGRKAAPCIFCTSAFPGGRQKSCSLHFLHFHHPWWAYADVKISLLQLYHLATKGLHF